MNEEDTEIVQRILLEMQLNYKLQHPKEILDMGFVINEILKETENETKKEVGED